MKNENLLLNAALAHHAAGRPVIAVNHNKQPYRKWKYLFTRPQREHDVRRQFANGAHGMAVVLYPACNYTVLDFDGRHAEEAWQSTKIQLPDTARNFSRNGGVHLYFKMPQEDFSHLRRAVRLVKADCDCLDRKGKPKPCGVDLLINGYAVFPPTPGYSQDPDHPLEDAVEIPCDILDLALRKQKAQTSRATGDADGKVRQGERKAIACSLAGTMRARAMSIEAIRAALKADNEARFDPPLEDNEVEDVAKSAAGWDRGPTTEPENLTDLGNAKRFMAMHTGNVFYSAERCKWILWNDRFWQWDITGVVFDLAEQTIRGIYAEASRVKKKDIREALSAHAVKSESRAKIEAMLKLAQSLPEIRTELSKFDRHSYLFNAANRTIDLKTGRARKFSREDFLTKISPTVYDADAKCPRFMEFLDIVTLGRKDLAKFIQRAAGYSLTDSTKEQCVFLLYGSGGNGKSTLVNLLGKVFGPDYAQQLKTEILFESRYENKDYFLADLVGIRFAAACEASKRRKLAAALVKQATGGEPLKARRPFEMPIQFEPHCKLWFSTNHKPRIDDTTDAMWRRILPIPFDAKFTEEKRIKGYEETLIEEASGILNWMIEGCLEWQRRELDPPPIVKAMTKEYREEEDLIGSFITDNCEVNPTDWVPAKKLYESYTNWCQEHGEKAETATAFGIALSEKGFLPAKKNGIRVRMGLNLAP